MPNLRLPKARTISLTAGFWRRAIALVFDILVLQLIIITPFSPVLEKAFPEQRIITEIAPVQLFLVLAICLVAMIYFAWLEHRFGQTIGMMVANIKARGDLRFRKTLLRNIWAIPIVPFALLWIIEPIMVATRKKRVLEMITKTETVYETTA